MGRGGGLPGQASLVWMGVISAMAADGEVRWWMVRWIFGAGV